MLQCLRVIAPDTEGPSSLAFIPKGSITVQKSPVCLLFLNKTWIPDAYYNLSRCPTCHLSLRGHSPGVRHCGKHLPSSSLSILKEPHGVRSFFHYYCFFFLLVSKQCEPWRDLASKLKPLDFHISNKGRRRGEG